MTSLKTLLFAVVPVLMISSATFAADDFLSEVADLDVSSIVDADNMIEDASLAGLDIDELASNASTKSEDAIEACFRSFGYGGGCGYRNYGCNYGYSNYGCYNSCYNYNYCQPSYYCYRPCYTYCQPITYTYCQPVTYTYCQPVTYSTSVCSNYCGCY